MRTNLIGKLTYHARGASWILMLLPALVVLGIFFLIPLGKLAQFAFYKYDPIWIYKTEFTLANFTKFFSSGYYWGMVWNTLGVGFFTTLFTVVVAYPVAYYLTLIKGSERTILSAGFLAGIFVTMLVGTLGWYILFLPFGLLQRALNAVGLLAGPLKLLKTMPALIAVLVYLHLPYAILILASSIQTVPKEKTDAARILGAPTWKVFSSIFLPLTMPGIVSTAILVFALSSSSYLVPILITGQSIELLPIGIWRYTNELMNWPFGAAIALILFLITISVTYLFIVVTNCITRRGKWEMV